MGSWNLRPPLRRQCDFSVVFVRASKTGLILDPLLLEDDEMTGEECVLLWDTGIVPFVLAAKDGSSPEEGDLQIYPTCHRWTMATVPAISLGTISDFR